MTTPCFTMDNTAGYSQAQLDELNRQFEKACLLSENSLHSKESQDFLAERVQTRFDAELEAARRAHDTRGSLATLATMATDEGKLV